MCQDTRYLFSCPDSELDTFGKLDIQHLTPDSYLIYASFPSFGVVSGCKASYRAAIYNYCMLQYNPIIAGEISISKP